VNSVGLTNLKNGMLCPFCFQLVCHSKLFQGICVEDLIVEFGSVNAGNFRSLQDIGTVVQHSQDHSLSIQVKRHDKIVRLSLTPHVWAGRGLLGCNIIPVETVER
jgi:26S proteasome non-ATPase regulatory subunit 9